MQGIEVPPFRAVGRLGGVGPSTVRISGLGGTVKGLWRRRKTEECWAPCSACEPGNQEFSPSQGEEGVSSESQPRSGVCFVWVGQSCLGDQSWCNAVHHSKAHPLNQQRVSGQPDPPSFLSTSSKLRATTSPPSWAGLAESSPAGCAGSVSETSTASCSAPPTSTTAPSDGGTTGSSRGSASGGPAWSSTTSSVASTGAAVAPGTSTGSPAATGCSS